jgi:hypothetical protein
VWQASFTNGGKQGKIGDVPAEHAPKGHSVTPSPCAALGMHVVTSMCPYTDLEGGKLSVQTLVLVSFLLGLLGPDVVAGWLLRPWVPTTRALAQLGLRVAVHSLDLVGALPQVWRAGGVERGLGNLGG